MRLAHSICASLLLAATLTGCAASPRTNTTPDDFSFGIVVPSALRDADLAPGWIVVDPDGGVREFAGEVTRDTRLPRRATTLSRDKLDALHQQLADASILNYGAVGEPVGDASAVFNRTGMVGVWWSANGRRRSMLLSPALSEDAAALAVIAQAYRDVRTQTWEPTP
ncbi:MAG TPA: hypothetical protein VK157_17315 [Phycisphaerales bacterium]|nr:hypothetical protein [Phycisphaerales bacterium]